MKTILYQPLFINPQAYFVFPQLYHIEKGDSYIEPANITGQLIFVDTNKDINTNENPSNSSISSTYVYDIEREGDLTYPEDKEECIAYGMSTSPNRLIWGDYETTEPLKFTDYITIHRGHNMLAEFYYKTDNIGYINSYIKYIKHIYALQKNC